jgi:drug/metabolite transporter (DMT)-like permease
VVVIWGTNYTIVKEALDSIPALAFMALRFGLAALAMGVLLWRLEGWKPLPRSTFLRLTALGLLGNTLYQLLFILGIARTTALYNTGLPVVAALTSWAVRGEPPTVLQALGAALILAGVLISRRR